MHTVRFKHGISRTLGRFFTSSLAKPMARMHPKQAESLKERCLLVDRNDNVIGIASKKECHLVKKDGSLPLHRAFSVFVFDLKGDLLIQKRASSKVMYPDHYGSSCLGHPIANFPEELNEDNAMGVKLAAVRRLKSAYGLEGLHPSEVSYITRLYYSCNADGKWGEHHINYVLIVQKPLKLKPNPWEISEFSLVPKGELMDFLPSLRAPLTPFFHQIIQHRLPLWWNYLDNLAEVINHHNIAEMEGCV